MIADNQDGGGNKRQTLWGLPVPWLRLLLGLALGGVGFWFAFRDTDLAAVGAALQQASLEYVLLALLAIILTGFVKSWRWQLLFYPTSPLPPYRAVFWSLYLAQLANTILPFLRVGEIVRIVELDRRTGVGKARVLGTLVAEKTLEMIILALIILFLIPLLVVPPFVRDSGLVLAVSTLLVFGFVWVVAVKTELVLRITKRVMARLPARLTRRVFPILVNGLRGLAALRNRRALAGLMGSSLLIGLLYVLPPTLLFRAFNIDLGLPAGAAIHAVTTLGTLPSWAPANAGVFEFLAVFMLRFFGETAAGTIAAYALIYHVVIVLPQIVLGGVAAQRGRERHIAAGDVIADLKKRGPFETAAVNNLAAKGGSGPQGEPAESTAPNSGAQETLGEGI